MSQVIRIPSHIYSRLEQHARGFDTPANVIEKLLNHYDGLNQESIVEKKSRDKTKFSFNKKEYGKNRLVLEVVREYVSKHSNITFEELMKIFPKEIQGSLGVFNKLDYVTNKFHEETNKRHFTKQEDIIKLSDCSIVVCTEWKIGNIEDFIKQAELLGFNITQINR